MKPIVSIVLLMLGWNAYCQNCSIEFFNESDIPVRTDSSTYKRVLSFDSQKKYCIVEKQYYINNSLKRTGQYILADRKITLPDFCLFDSLIKTRQILKDGLFKEWYENGKPESEITYRKGELKGLPVGWDENGEQLFVVVEESARFMGYEHDMDSLNVYIANHINYPEEAYDKKIQGRVLIRFAISKTGEVTDVNIFRKVHPLLDNEAKRVIEGLPAWTPGKTQGKPVKQIFIIPIDFKVSRQEAER